MKKLNDQVIIYDDACPMCTAYTGTFIRLGWLSRRIAFSRIDPKTLQNIDVDRGRHEIPLYNPENDTTVYGLDALFLIIGTRYPFLRPLFRSCLFRLFWKQIYWIITYNRRIIAGSPAPATGMDCAPDRHLGYRWLYIVLMLFWSAMILEPEQLLTHPTSPVGLLLIGLPIVWLIAGLILKEDRLSWLGHWVTIAFITSVLLWVLPATSVFIGITGLASVFLFWKRWKLL